MVKNYCPNHQVHQQELEKRVKLTQNYLRAVFAISYDKMTIGENGKKDHSIFYKAVRDRFVIKSDKEMTEMSDL